MTARVLVFDAYRPGDAALENSHWMAEVTCEELGAAAERLTHPRAVRAELESRLDDPIVRGIALFGHGDPGRLHMVLRTQYRRESLREAIEDASEGGAVYGSDGSPALDLNNLHVLAGRWCHALACSVGLSLVHPAIEHGATCFVAYASSLAPEFDAATMPPGLHAHLAALVTATTKNLLLGIQGETVLKQCVYGLSGALEDWLESDEGGAWADSQAGYMQVAGIRGFARQLWREMVVQPDAWPEGA